jgi:hypothetical protein
MVMIVIRLIEDNSASVEGRGKVKDERTKENDPATGRESEPTKGLLE